MFSFYVFIQGVCPTDRTAADKVQDVIRQLQDEQLLMQTHYTEVRSSCVHGVNTYDTSDREVSSKRRR